MIQKFNITIAGKRFPLLFDLEPEKFYSDQVLAAILPKGILPEPEVVNALPHLIKLGDTCVDAGANIGFFSVLMSKLVGPEGRVVAVEPDHRNFQKLRRNLDINDCVNTTIIAKPLAAKRETRRFYLHGENGSSTLFDGATVEEAGKLIGTEELNTDTLDDIARFLDRPVTLLKLDVEGAELEAMEGARKARPKFVIAELNKTALERAGTSIDEFRLCMEVCPPGYWLHLLSETGAMPAIVAPPPHQKLVTTRPNTNVLFAKGWDVVQAWPEIIL